MTSPADPATSAGAQPLTPAVRGALIRYRVIAWVVGVMLLLLVFVAMPLKYFADNPDFRHSWPAHCVAGTEGVGFHPNFAPAVASGAIDAVFDKGAYAAAYSGFEGADENGVRLADWLRAREVTEVDVVGIATDHCVRATALDAAREGFRTQALLDLTAGVAAETTERALEELRGAGVELTGKPVVA